MKIKNLFLILVVIIVFMITINIDFIQHRRSHKNHYTIMRENNSGWATTNINRNFKWLVVRDEL